jgi:uncharacterized protein YjiS (DUF1127 family)
MFALHAEAGAAGAAAPNRPFAGPLGRLRIAVRSWYRRKRAIAALHALSDRSLADIGIARSEIDAVVGAHYRRASLRAAPRG